MYYFGTSLTNAGHYFWMLMGDKMICRNLSFPIGNGIDVSRFADWPFNPEELLKQPRGMPDLPKGTVKYFRIGGYAIAAIEGSCKDTRGGTKSVFFTTEEIKLGQLRDKILSIPIAKRIIEQMPFEVMWNVHPDITNANEKNNLIPKTD